MPTAASARHPNRASRVLGRSTALIAAAFEGHTLVVEQLIAAGAALDVQNIDGYGPCPNCNCLTLLQTGSRLLGRCTALISAAMNGHTLVVEQLIAAGAALDVQENYG